MKVNPQYNTVGTFFSDKAVYTVPTYQRGYAWENQEIEDFLKDLKRVFDARKNQRPVTHFLGSIITVEHQLQGVVGKHNHELVDGQQRLATFVLLAAAICKQLQKIIEIADNQNDTTNKNVAEERHNELTKRFVEFRQEVNRVSHTQRVMTLSKTDNNFFVELLRGNQPIPQRESHKRLQNAYVVVANMVENLIKDLDIAHQLDNLEILVQNIDGDFALLRIVTDNQNNASSMFQVLNDRGKGLTEGELLRSRVLEMLEAHPVQQTPVEQYWDDILKDKNTQIEDFLRWIYASCVGVRPSTNALFDDFLLKFYPESNAQSITSAQADDIHNTTERLKSYVEILRKLKVGDWLFPHRAPVTDWHRNRLRLLMVDLNNTNSMPLLLAASLLDHVKFSEIVSMVERMMFRYTIICGQHHSALTDIYEAESYKIRQNPSGYRIGDLQNKLQDLLNKKADDRTFRSALDTFSYKKNGVSNKPLKYFLKTVEDYWRWFEEDGAVGSPVCKDTAQWCRFEDATIEHIYPYTAPPAIFDSNVEDLKNTIGNLTLLSGLDNSSMGNDDFAQKRNIFRTVGISMTRELANEMSWGRIEIVRRTEKLKDMALKIFKMV